MTAKAARLLLSAASLAALLAAPAPIFAHEGVDEHAACKDDFAKFCKDVAPGEGRIMKCMKDHDAELSPSCKEHLGAKQTAWKAGKTQWDKACAQDVAALCKDVKPGEGRIIDCLKQKQDKVSQGCKDLMATAMKLHEEKAAAYKEAWKACAADKQKFCKDVQEGGGRIAECLHAHAADLSSECKQASGKTAKGNEPRAEKGGDKDSEKAPESAAPKSTPQ